MKKSWKDNNMLLREASYEEYPDYSDAYYKVILTYNTKEERDKIFDWLKEISNEEMITLRKIDDDKIKVIKYISISFKDNENEDIEKWVEEIAEETDALSSEIEETSYEEYHDTFIEKKERKNIRENNFYNRLFKDKEISGLYEELKNAIGASDLCDEIATSMDKDELKGILNHISEMYL